MPVGPSIEQSNAQVAQAIPQFEAWKQQVGQALMAMGLNPSMASVQPSTATGPYALMPQGDTVSLPGGVPYLLSASDMDEDPNSIAKQVKSSWEWNNAYTGQNQPQQAAPAPMSAPVQAPVQPQAAPQASSMFSNQQALAPAAAQAQPAIQRPGQGGMPRIPALGALMPQSAGQSGIDPLNLLLQAYRGRGGR